MGLFKTSGGKNTRIVFYVTVHTLSPWPTNYGLLAVEWERGSKRRGRTKAVAPSRIPGQNANVYRFEETIRVPCTLVEDKNSVSGFEKKCLLLTVVESQSKSNSSKDKERLGSVVLNLSEYAIGPGEMRHSVQVACRKEITKDTGNALFEVSIRSKDKKTKQGVNGSDEGSSYAGSYADTSTVVSEKSGVGRDSCSLLSATSAEQNNWHHSSHGSSELHGEGFLDRYNTNRQPIQEQVFDEDGILLDEDGILLDEGHTSQLDRVHDPPLGSNAAAYRTEVDDYRRRSGRDPDAPGGYSSAGVLQQHSSPLPANRRPSSTATSTESETDHYSRHSLGHPDSQQSDPTPHRLGRIISGQEYASFSHLGRGKSADSHPAAASGAPSLAPRRWKSSTAKINSTPRDFGNPRLGSTPGTMHRKSHSGDDMPFKTSSSGSDSKAYREPARTPVSDVSNFTDVDLDHDKADSSPFMEVEASAEQYGGNGHQQYGGATSTRPAGEPASRLATPQAHTHAHAAQTHSAAPAAGHALSANLDDVLMELRTSAALEASIYLARKRRVHQGGPACSSSYAPARRIARTIITLGADEGVIFGLRAVKGIQYECDACVDSSGDVCGVSFWWSNCVQLRWMVWAVCGGPGTQSPRDAQGEALASFNTILQVIVPPMKDLEEYMFYRMANHLWHNVLLPTSLAYTIDTKQHQAPSQGEMAVYRWLAGLSAVFNALSPIPGGSAAQTSGVHMGVLRQQMMAAMMRKMDTTLLRALTWDVMPPRRVNGASNVGRRRSSNSSSTSRMSDIPAIGVDAKLLPFEVISLTFGEGVALKMALTRWQEWAREAGLQEEVLKDRLGFFPKLRAAADLLMFPKDMLMDNATRQEILPVLAIDDICIILNKFVPDDFAPDSVPRGLVQALRREAEMFPQPEPQAKQWTYEPMAEKDLLEAHLIEPISLDMDDDSDDELTALEHMYELSGQQQEVHRFALLKDLWASAR